MTGEAAIRIHKQSVVRKSIYGRHVRMSDLILTGLIYLCAGLSIASSGRASWVMCLCGESPICSWAVSQHGHQRHKGHLWNHWEIL